MTSWNPIRRSSVHRTLLDSGAVMTDSAGWRLPLHFGDAAGEAEAVRSRVGLADASALNKWEVKGTAIGKALAEAAGDSPDPGHVVTTDSGWLSRISFKQALLISDQEDPTLVSRLRQQDAGEACCHLLSRHDGFAHFRLSGPSSASVLAKLGAFDLRESSFPDLRCMCGPLAKVQAIVVRRDQYGLPGYEVLLSSEYGPYVWGATLEAGREFQMRLYGRDAKRLLED